MSFSTMNQAFLCIKWLEHEPWLLMIMFLVVGHYRFAAAFQQCYVELQVRNIIDFMLLIQLKRKLMSLSAPPFNFTTFFSQLHALLLSWRSEGFEFPSLTFSECSPFISSRVCPAAIWTLRSYQVCEILSVFASRCFLFRLFGTWIHTFKRLAGKSEQLIAIAEHS